MAGHKGNAEARRIAADFGMGRHIKAWRRASKTLEWAMALGFVIGFPVVLALLRVGVQEPSGRFRIWYWVVFGVVVWLPVLIVLRSRRTVLYEFEAGLANVSRYRRRVTVLRWADLASVSEDITQDQEGDRHFHGWLFHDLAGNSVTVGKRARALKVRAEQLLAASASGAGQGS